MSNFNPWGPPRPCWQCTCFDGLVYQGTAALCTLRNGPRVRSAPANGCSAWEREPGSDDEPDRVPASRDILVASAVKAMPLPAAPPIDWAP